MNRTTRIAVLATAALAGLALAVPALASYTPRIAISHKTVAKAGTHPTTIHVTIPQTDDPTAKITILVPTGYTIAPSAPGTTIGSATASVLARDVGLTLPLQGAVTADDPATHAADPCDPQPHLAVWLLALSVAGQNITVPVYVDQTAGPVAALAAYTIDVCFTPPDVPPGTPNRAPMGAQPLDADFTVGTMTLPGGSQTLPWRALFTPYNPGLGTPNVAGTVEARSFVGLPGAVSIGAKYVTKTNTYRLAGRVTAGGTGVGDVKVRIYRGRSVKGLAARATTTAKANGSYATAGHLRPKKTTFFQARVAVGERDDAAGCSATLPPLAATPPPCVSSTLGGFSAFSSIVRIRL